MIDDVIRILFRVNKTIDICNGGVPFSYDVSQLITAESIAELIH